MAAKWAESARLNSPLGVVGPYGSVIMPGDREHYVIFTDVTALPAAARWLQEAPRCARLTVLVVASGDGDYLSAEMHPHAEIVECETHAIATEILGRLQLDGAFIWAAGEASWVGAVRGLLGFMHVPRASRLLSGHWRMGGKQTSVTALRMTPIHG